MNCALSRNITSFQIDIPKLMCLKDDQCVQSYLEFISVMSLFKKYFQNYSLAFL